MLMMCRDLIRISVSRRTKIGSIARGRCLTTNKPGERMRVAIVGGGAAGLSSALHLAPLVEQGMISSPIDIYEASSKGGREIGVGLWTTGLDPFRTSRRKSHQLLYEDLTHYGRWVGDVGYTTPQGAWLAQSHLPTEVGEAMEMPALLFLRECDFLKSLQRATHLEELHGNVKIHRGGAQDKVTGLWEESPRPYSAPLALSNGQATERDYHLIVAADGMNSTLRQQYGGHRRLQRLTGTNALFDSESASSAVRSWDDSEWQVQANVVEDRKYTVFRGNANLTETETGMNGVGFQTWGVGKRMRFATVPLSFPSGESKRTEKQVWFITTSDNSIAEEPDATKRREMLLAAFGDWHDPIPRMVEATPPDEILFERATAHRHSVPPVLNINQVLTSAKKRQPTASGPGPAMVFVGDSFMTVDPILAQGFTMAMEGAFQLAQAVEKGCQSNTDNKMLAFDPDALRKELKNRYEKRYDRLLCLLRATELVQALGQPQGGFGGFVSKNMVRPLMRLSPDFIKRPFFNAMLKYSLGVPIRKTRQ